MKLVHYGTQVFSVADDIADQIALASSEFANAKRSIALPVACYFDDRPTTEILVGVGIPVLIVDPQEPDDREDPPRTLESFAWITDEVESLQAQQ